MKFRRGRKAVLAKSADLPPIPKKTTGTTWQEVAKELGCSRATAFRRLAGRAAGSR